MWASGVAIVVWVCVVGLEFSVQTDTRGHSDVRTLMIDTHVLKVAVGKKYRAITSK